METVVVTDDMLLIIQFKSYYVVWKHKKRYRLHFYLRGFKSYYVVWKHTNRDRVSPEKNRFKSYYVVWKPSVRSTKSPPKLRLNRTMQYGNFFSSLIFFSFSWFKSYYVVWKRIMTQIILSHNDARLNRTMQYGNRERCVFLLCFRAV